MHPAAASGSPPAWQGAVGEPERAANPRFTPIVQARRQRAQVPADSPACRGPTTHHLPLKTSFGGDLSQTEPPELESPDSQLGFHVLFVLFLPGSDFW